MTNLAEDVDVVQGHLNRLGILSSADYVEEKPVQGTVVEKADLPKTIEAIEWFQEKVLHYGKRYEYVKPGGGTIKVLAVMSPKQKEERHAEYLAAKKEQEKEKTKGGEKQGQNKKPGKYSTKTDNLDITPNKIGGVNIQLDGKTYVFSKGGDPLYVPYQNLANLSYYRSNQKKFVKNDGAIAAFDEIFMSRDEWWKEIGTDMMIEVVEAIGGKTGANLEGKRLLKVKKYEKWRWHFPPRTPKETKQKLIREKEIKEINLLQKIPPQHLSPEESSRLSYLEKKWEKQ